MTDEEMLRDFLARGGEIKRLPYVPPKPAKRSKRHGKFTARRDLRPGGGRLS